MYKDKVDEKIIRYLKEDSRESFVDIGKKLKLSESAVRRRVKNLVDSGTIKTDTSKVSLKLAKLEGVKTVYEITGQYDITTIMSATNIAEINSTIDALRKIPGVVDTNTVIILRKII
jgi:DNA-binding Lrp family transcriptional regulator